MTEPFRFSPNENRAAEIDWRHWGSDAFEQAAEAERPILLLLTTTWCQACRELDETTLSDDRVIRLLNDELVPIRVDCDRMPHVQERYIAGGWPTCALLIPSGEVLWSDTLVGAHELRRAVDKVLEAWRDRRLQLVEEIQRRGKAMDAARTRKSAQRMVRREAADDVLTGAQDQFDPRNGGFGQAPKFIHAEGVELLFHQGRALPNPDWLAMAERTLDGMLAGEIQDRDGGFFHYALQADWTRPQYEKLLSINARVVSAYAAGVEHDPERGDWRDVVERTVAWVDRTLGRDGLWTGSQAAASAYYNGDPEARASMDPPAVDDTVYTDAAAQWIAALADAGRRLERDDWAQRAATGLDTLLDRMAAPDNSLVHYHAEGAEPPVGLLVDLLHGARAALAVARAGSTAALDHARTLASTMQNTLWDERGGFVDTPGTVDPLGALRFPDRPFEENARAARLFLALARATDDRSYRAVAERVLGFLSPVAGRYGVEGATFALAVEEFFQLRR